MFKGDLITYKNGITKYMNGVAEYVEYNPGISFRLRESDNSKRSQNVESNDERSNRRAKKSIKDLAQMNYFNFFVTLTFDVNGVFLKDRDRSFLNSYDLSDWGDVNKIISKFTHSLRRRIDYVGDSYDIIEGFDSLSDLQAFYGSDFSLKLFESLRFILVPEKHKSGVLHLHGLMYLPPSLITDLEKHKGDAYTFKRWTYGFSSFVYLKNFKEDSPKISNYITKYITKDMGDIVKKGQHRYNVSRGLLRPVSRYDVDVSILEDYEVTGFWESEDGHYKKTFLRLKNDIK